MSEMIEEVIGSEPLSLPEAYYLLKQARERILARRGVSNSIMDRTLEYLAKLSKCGHEEARRARRRLIEELGFDSRTAAILVSILPESIHEARVMLDFEKRLVETEELERALEILREECGSREEEQE